MGNMLTYVLKMCIDYNYRVYSSFLLPKLDNSALYENVNFEKVSKQCHRGCQYMANVRPYTAFRIGKPTQYSG